MPEISNYDGDNYDYRTYWSERAYEDQAEKIVLKKLMRGHKGKRFIDIGGSFGRNIPLYAKKYDEFVIMDYSLKTLLKYEKEILDEYPNAKLVAGNAYNLPFAKNSFDGAMTIRVLHHLEDPEGYLKAVSKVLAHNGILIQEIANKVHLKAAFKWIFTGNFEMLDQSPYKQPTRSDEEKEGSQEESVFLNFHPTHIKNSMKTNGFSNFVKSSCSFLRIPSLKKIFPLSFLVSLEKLMQLLFSKTNIAPSVFYKAKMVKALKSEAMLSKSFNEILRCPSCQKKLTFGDDGNTAECEKCNSTYAKHSTVWDLRA
jgi:ubiquinone/menaquinone biosynthesis C-methylase UbiE